MNEISSVVKSIIPVRMEAIVGGAAGGTGMIITYLFGEWNSALEALAMFMLIDYLSGVMAAYLKPRAKLSSKKGLRGIIKKLALICGVVFAHYLDVVLGQQNVFCLLATYTLLGNEGLSIIENLSYCGVPVPAAIKEKLEQLSQEKAEKKEGKG